MRKDDGWADLQPTWREAYIKFNATVAELPQSEQQEARDTLLLDLAGLFVDSAIRQGFSYDDVLNDITKMEQEYNGRDN
jgi:hypothetical protein